MLRTNLEGHLSIFSICTNISQTAEVFPAPRPCHRAPSNFLVIAPKRTRSRCRMALASVGCKLSRPWWQRSGPPVGCRYSKADKSGLSSLCSLGLTKKSGIKPENTFFWLYKVHWDLTKNSGILHCYVFLAYLLAFAGLQFRLQTYTLKGVNCGGRNYIEQIEFLSRSQDVQAKSGSGESISLRILPCSLLDKSCRYG